MSLINKMLQDLEKRGGGPFSPEPVTIAANLRPVVRPQVGSDWFWRILAFVLLFAVCWVAWLIWQITPRSVVTDKVNLSAKPPELVQRTSQPPKATTETGQAVKDGSPHQSALQASGAVALRLATEIVAPDQRSPKAPRTAEATAVVTRPPAEKPAPK